MLYRSPAPAVCLLAYLGLLTLAACTLTPLDLAPLAARLDPLVDAADAAVRSHGDPTIPLDVWDLPKAVLAGVLTALWLGRRRYPD